MRKLDREVVDSILGVYRGIHELPCHASQSFVADFSTGCGEQNLHPTCGRVLPLVWHLPKRSNRSRYDKGQTWVTVGFSNLVMVALAGSIWKGGKHQLEFLLQA